MNPIIVPLRNSLPLTMAAHQTFLYQDIEVELLYINNASTDGTQEWLNSLDGVHVIHNSTPKSVAASWNQGLKFFFRYGAEHALVCNNDVLLRPDTYHWLLEAKGDFVTGVGNNDPKCIKSLSPPNLDNTRPHPDFSCFLITRSTYEKLGGFDESYKGGYVEDAETHLKLHRMGVRAFCIDLPFYHVGAGTLKGADDAEKKRIVEAADANRRLFKERHGVDVGTDGYYQLFGGTRPEVDGFNADKV